ncbi:MAG TPA: cytochrome c oxidase subunit II [Candidatus Didemnitutus sp.]|nr:cytochrome c oxidase subunit II [Candidatus Didemnitutus sp.]
MSAGAPLVVAMIDGVMAGASRVSPAVDAIFLALLLTCGVVTLGVTAFVLYYLVRYRRSSPAPRPSQRWPEWVWETLWTSATVAVFLVFFAVGARVYLRMETPPADAIPIEVIGRQWMWDVRHADGRREFNAVHVPVNQAILLRLSSEDVIHSFAVPAFRLKQDVVPGKTTTTWFEATRTGEFPIYCDQYCGTAHSEMNGVVVVESAGEFARWQAAGAHVGQDPDRGARLFATYGCAGCHQRSEKERAPSLGGLAGKMVALADGTRARVDDDYLRESILQPGARVVAGYGATMPSYAGMLSDQDVSELVAYLKRLPADDRRLASAP